MLKKWIILLLTMVCVLTACHAPIYDQTEGNIADVKLKSSEARQKSDDSAKPQPALLMKQGLYVDTTPINLERQPSWLHNHIVIRGDQLPFSYYSRTIANGAGSLILTKYQAGLDQSTAMSLNYSGTVKGALEVLASKTGYVYTIRGNTIYWQAFVTKTFDVAFLPGATDYLMGKSGGGGGSSSNSATSASQNYTSTDESSAEFSNIKGSLSVWDDLKATVTQLLTSDGKVTVSQATTSVTVRDKPGNVALVSQFINNLNVNLTKQVLVKVQILEVDLSSDYNYGINWQMIVKAFHNSPFMVNGSYGTPIVITPLSAQSAITGLNPGIPAPPVPQFGTAGSGLPSYTILLNALSQQGKTSLVSEPRVVCLNNQVSAVRVVTTQGYVASIQNTTLSGTSGTAPTSTVTSQITPGSITTGLTLYILPKIMGKKIFMQVNADLSLKQTIVNFGPVGAQVQLPTVSEKHFNQRSVILSGDTLILSGFRQVGNSANANQLLESQSLGGKASQQMNSETVILITPIILNGGPA